MGNKSFSVYTSFKAKDGMSSVFQNMKNSAFGFGSQLTRISSNAKSVSNSLKNTFGGLKTFVGIVTAGIATNTIKNTFEECVNLASDLQETLGKTNETFKTNSSEVIAWSKSSINSMGLAQQTALDTASLYGDMGTGMGLTTKRASEMAMRLTELSADLSSFKNMSQEVTKNALKGIFTGETEALKNLGTVMTQAQLEDYVKSLGINKNFKDMSQTEKVELRYKYVFDYNKNAHGDTLKTMLNYASQKRKNEQLKKQLKTDFGGILLPIYTKPLTQINNFIEKHQKQFIATFKNGVNYIMGIVESFNPVIKELKTTIKLIFGDTKNGAKTLAPIISDLIKNVLAPGLALSITAFNKLYQIISKTCAIIKFIFIPLVPILSGLLTGLAVYKTVQFFQSLQVQLTLLKMQAGGGLIGALKLLTVNIWKSVPAIWAQTTALLSNPLFWIPAIITTVITAIILFVKNWKLINECINNTKEFLLEFLEKALNVFGTIGNYIKNNFISVLLSALSPISLIIGGFNRLSDKFKSGGSLLNFGKTNLNAPTTTATPPLLKNTYISNMSGSSGIVEIKNIVENKSTSLVTTSTKLSQAHNLTLTPVQ